MRIPSYFISNIRTNLFVNNSCAVKKIKNILSIFLNGMVQKRMFRLYAVVIYLFFSLSLAAQDNCSNPTVLCANSKITATTQGATTVASDPALNCGDLTVNN